MSLSYSWTFILHFNGLLISIQVSISSVFSLCHTLFHYSCFVGLDLRSQCGFTILGQNRGQISSHSREIKHGSTIRYS